MWFARIPGGVASWTGGEHEIELRLTTEEKMATVHVTRQVWPTSADECISYLSLHTSVRMQEKLKCPPPCSPGRHHVILELQTPNKGWRSGRHSSSDCRRVDPFFLLYVLYHGKMRMHSPEGSIVRKLKTPNIGESDSIIVTSMWTCWHVTTAVCCTCTACAMGTLCTVWIARGYTRKTAKVRTL